MNETQAITLLASCKPLARKLIGDWYDISLETEDEKQLQDYRRVVEDGWIESLTWDFIGKAGLSKEELVLLASCSVWNSRWNKS